MRARLLLLPLAAGLLVTGPPSALAATFTESFPRTGDRAFGSAVWWNQDAWDVRSDTYGIATRPEDEGGAWKGHYAAIAKAGTGTMQLSFQGIVSARLRNPMQITGSRSGVVRFKAPLFVTTGHWWEVAITPADQPTAAEYTAVPARQSPEGLNNPLTGKDDDGSTNGPGHRASIEDSVNVISTGFPDAPECNDSGWHARWALTSARGGRVTDHVNPRRGGLDKLYDVDPRRKNALVSWKLVYSPSRVTLHGDRDRDGKLEKVDSWKVRIPWKRVSVQLLHVAYQAGHHPAPDCGYGRHGITQTQTTAWRDVRVSPVVHSGTTALPRPGTPGASDWSSYDLRDMGAHVGSGQPNARPYDLYRSYLACSKDSGGGIPCPDRARTTVPLRTTVAAADLRGLSRVQLLADVRYAGRVRVAVNGKDVGALPRVGRRPDVLGANGFTDAFEPEAWVRRGLDLPVSALGAGVNTVTLSLSPDENVEVDRLQLELGRG